MEPNATAVAALYSPDTGIVDSHSLMKYFYNRAEDNGVIFAFNSEVNRLDKANNGFVVGVQRDAYQFRSKVVINCAGLSSDYIARLAGIDIQKKRL